jgi:hypothetical protein
MFRHASVTLSVICTCQRSLGELLSGGEEEIYIAGVGRESRWLDGDAGIFQGGAQ